MSKLKQLQTSAGHAALGVPLEGLHLLRGINFDPPITILWQLPSHMEAHAQSEWSYFAELYDRGPLTRGLCESLDGVTISDGRRHLTDIGYAKAQRNGGWMPGNMEKEDIHPEYIFIFRHLEWLDHIIPNTMIKPDYRFAELDLGVRILKYKENIADRVVVGAWALPTIRVAHEYTAMRKAAEPTGKSDRQRVARCRQTLADPTRLQLL